MSELRPLVMIAEDNPGLARAMSLKFEQSGFDTMVARDGQAAWELFQTHAVAAIVSDQEMPRMTGLDLCRSIRRHDSKVPFVLVTGRQLEIMSSGIEKELDIRHVFGKPFSPNELIASIREAIVV